ncbi:MAG TPA: FAD-dependent oxidoreductase [Gemmatimonadales bacterium]|nr:FAD-dependent oxidoreductase [Gemmatimonadales bacterium]
MVTVVGAGVAGLCAASELVARGVDVRVVDRGGGPGPHSCSWWAGGMLAPFCEGESAERTVVDLGQEAASWWTRHGCHVVNNGTLVVALERDQASLAQFARRTSGHRTLNAIELDALEPHLAGRFARALHFEQESHLAPREALAALVESLRSRGVQIETGEWIPGDNLTVDCRGYGARADIASLRGVKGEMLVLRCPDVSLRRPVRLLHPRHPLYVVPRGSGVFMLGATQVESGEQGRITARSMLELLSAAYALHPAFAEAEVVEIGTHVRPAYPDNVPRVSRNGKMLHVNGLFRHGFLLAPAMARIAADAITGDSQ